MILYDIELKNSARVIFYREDNEQHPAEYLRYIEDNQNNIANIFVSRFEETVTEWKKMLDKSYKL